MFNLAEQLREAMFGKPVPSLVASFKGACDGAAGWFWKKVGISGGAPKGPAPGGPQ
jgi:hypothetical protein